ncbi:MAG: hypothetical protein IKC10_01595 [Alphaproteobacteria bacterium]|nr:hypothetical protein [Alphaproteobacteria bacterium]
MNVLKKLSCFFIVLSALSFCGNDVYAQNVLKMDFLKTGGKFGNWVQKQAENFEKSMKEIGESQFAVFIGKGIDAAKKGIQFARDKFNEVRNIYNMARETVNAVKQSNAYKIAMLSTLAASETLVLNNIKKQRDSELGTKKAELEINKLELEEKIKIAKENFAVGIEIMENEVAELRSEEERDVKRKEIDDFRKSNQEAIESLESELTQLEENYKEDVKAIETNFAMEILAQTAVIADIGDQIAELSSQKKNKKEQSPEKAIEEAINDYSYKEGEVITMEARDKKEKSRKRKRLDIALSASGYSSGIIAKTEEKKEEEKQNSEISETVNGKSESLQTAISQTIVQLDSLYEYLVLELKSIQLETANMISNKKDYKAGEIKASVNICDYIVDPKDFIVEINDENDTSNGVNDNSDEDITGLTGM